jgi:hypothetical protein
MRKAEKEKYERRSIKRWRELSNGSHGPGTEETWEKEEEGASLSYLVLTVVTTVLTSSPLIF